ncbi:GXWXG domain-containing protein [Tranquillimonas rosea]|uniref:GXWXG domain-containing protein n=1 Tax=Tranquillimonas rosea TaxID=641238 RepID=UPI003BA97F84
MRDAERWILDVERAGTEAGRALAVFDGLEAVAPDEMIGRWDGRGIHTGHPLDGLLEAADWRGKAFLGPDLVHPLLVGQGGASLDAGRIPLGLTLRLRPQRWPGAGAAIRACRPLFATARPTARLREMRHRGRLGAAMIYDRQPIIDHFRRAGPDLLLGLMELRGTPPLFFTLRRRAGDKSGRRP